MGKEKYVAKLTEDEYSYLKMLVGNNVIQVFAPNLSVQGTEYESSAYCFSLRKEKEEWINLTNSWLETPNDGSYYKIAIDLSDKPDGIELSGEGYLLNASSIFVGCYIVKIEVYTRHQEVFGDTVQYDKAIILYTDKGNKFCISAIESVRDQLTFTFDEEAIEKEIYGCVLRETIL